MRSGDNRFYCSILARDLLTQGYSSQFLYNWSIRAAKLYLEEQLLSHAVLNIYFFLLLTIFASK